MTKPFVFINVEFGEMPRAEVVNYCKHLSNIIKSQTNEFNYIIVPVLKNNQGRVTISQVNCDDCIFVINKDNGVSEEIFLSTILQIIEEHKNESR